MQREIKLLKEEAAEQEAEMQSLRNENTEVHNLRVRCFELEQQHEQDGLLQEQGTALSSALQQKLKETSREYFSEAIERNGQLLEWQRKRGDAAEAEKKALKEQLAQLVASYDQETEQHKEVKQSHLLMQSKFNETSTKLHALQHMYLATLWPDFATSSLFAARVLPGIQLAGTWAHEGPMAFMALEPELDVRLPVSSMLWTLLFWASTGNCTVLSDGFGSATYLSLIHI